MDTRDIKELLYNKPIQDVIDFLAECSEKETLHIYAYNYNWNNGFEVPKAIIDNPICTLSTALMIFYLADGYRYLNERTDSSEVPEWIEFVSKLYKRICSGYYKDVSISFSVPLSKVQIFKLKKQLNEDEQVFIIPVEGKDCDISL